MTETLRPRPRSLRFAVVGCGNIGSRHLAVIEGLEGATVSAFCDTDPEKLKKYAELYADALAYESIEELLAGCPADVVNICTPHYLHCANILRR